MKKSFYVILIILNSTYIFSQVKQEDKVSNSNKDWYFGIEVGLNTIPSYNLGEKNKSFQGGFLAEYYFSKNWSLQSKLKYFKTGASFIANSKTVKFDGTVLSIPIDIKKEISINDQFEIYLKLGLAANYQVKSHYSAGEPIEKDKSFFGSLNSGIGINYFMSKKICFFVDLEYYRFGSHVGSQASLFLPKNYYKDNNHLSVGVKYNFKN